MNIENFTICKYCGELLDKDAKRCPVCGGTVLENNAKPGTDYNPPLNPKSAKHKKSPVNISPSKHERAYDRKQRLAVVLSIVIALVILITAISYNCYVNYYRNSYSSAEVGDSLTFGKYNGESIWWIVLKKNDSSMTVISKDVLCERIYSDSDKTNWADSSLCEWLNEDFYNSSFSTAEKGLMCTADTANNNKVTILTETQAKTYFSSDDERKATYVDGFSNGWWLTCGSYVNVSGYVIESRQQVDLKGGVRPVIKLELE